MTRIVFNGVIVPLAYREADYEYDLVRSSVGLFDMSATSKIALSGPGAGSLLDRLLSRPVSNEPAMKIVYALICNARGHVDDDVIVYKLAADEYLVMPALTDCAWFERARDRLGLSGVAIVERSADLAGLAVQGPLSASLLRCLGLSDIETLKPFQARTWRFADTRLVVGRMGFTGDLGYECWLDGTQCDAFCAALDKAGSALDIDPRGYGFAAVEALRIEAGLIVPGRDFATARVSGPGLRRYPAELGLDRFVRFDGRAFTGRDALLAQASRGPRFVFRHFVADCRAEDIRGAALMAPAKRGTAVIGRVTSASWSWGLGKTIGLASVDARYADAGAAFVDADCARLPVTFSARPAFDVARHRETPASFALPPTAFPSSQEPPMKKPSPAAHSRHNGKSEERGGSVNLLGRYSSSARISRRVIAENIRRKVPNMSYGGWLGTPLAAQLGYLIGRILGTRNGGEPRYTLFANSALEAMYAVIRLCRQTSYAARGANAHKVLIHDVRGQYRAFFDPLSAGAEDALCPQVHFTHDEAGLRDLIARDPQGWSCTIVVRQPGYSVERRVQETINALAAETGSLRVQVNAELGLHEPGLFSVPEGTDIVIFGETLTDCEVPFGAFSVSESAYQIWNTRETLATYTSTFFGNASSLSTAIAALRERTTYVTEVDEHVMGSIADSFETRLQYFRRYVHPIYADLFVADKGDLDLVTAEGAHLGLADGRTLFDLSTLGCSLRGHNPSDVVAEVLDAYDPATDYLAQVMGELRMLTPFSRLLPSVSGAGAVDAAVSAALLANAPRRKVVCLGGNYSGKTLTAVNFSRTAPLLADRDQSAFEPYYRDAIYIDPFADDAEEQFLAAVGDGDVALVWFELVQGYMVKRLPAALIALVERHKSQFGYLIGVDEVLTGMWKNGRSLLFHHGLMSKVDVTSMSKATSDMIFPISWALVTEDVHRRARANGAETLQRLENAHRNNLGAAIALHGLRKGREFFEANDLTEDLAAFHGVLKDIAARSDLFEAITAEGCLLRPILNKNAFPYQEGSVHGMLIENAISHLLLHSAGILSIHMRMFLPSIHGAREREEMVERMTRALARITPASVYAYMLCQDYALLDALGMKAHFKASLLAAAAA